MKSPLLIADSPAGQLPTDTKPEAPTSEQRILALEQQVQELTCHVKHLDQWGKLDWSKKGDTKA